MVGLLTVAPMTYADVVDIVTNGDFLGGVYTDAGGNPGVPNGWTPNAGFDLNPQFNFVDTNQPIVVGVDISNSVSISNYDYQPLATLSQTLSTVVGETYTGSFYVAAGGAGDTNAFFQASIDGNTLVSLTESSSSIPFTLETFSFIGTGTDTLTFAAQTNPSEWYFGNVIVNGASPVPIPTSIVMFATGLLGFAASRKKAKLA